MNDHSRVRVALVGEGDQARRWASVLQDIADVRPEPERLSGAIDALVLAPGSADPFARAKAALLGGVPVLYAAPFRLSPWQAAWLNELSRRQGRLLRFVESFQCRGGFAFLRRLLQGTEPFWRPLYLRTLCLAQSSGPARIDELATEELAACEALVGDEPHSVTAVASRRDEAGDMCAVFLILHYGDGLVVHCTVSVAEGTNAHQVVAVTPDHTAIIDDLGPVATLRIVGGGEQEPFAGDGVPAPSGQSRGDRTLASSGSDLVGQEASRFLSAVTMRDLSAGNGDRWSRVAALWWAARQSMNSGSPTEVPVPALRSDNTEPPLLRVIQGGGTTDRTAWRRPSLTVVAR